MFTEQESITVNAPAKINLFLDVLGKRANGYHDIRSIIVPVSLYDTLAIKLNGGGLGCSMESAGLSAAVCAEVKSEKNLVTHAAQALREAGGVSSGAQVHIIKRIPMGGGLGGGSADAAAALCALNRLWQLDWPCERLAEIGVEVGCDVPALLRGCCVCAEGLGERVSPLEMAVRPVDIDDWWGVLVNPLLPVSTRDIYERHSLALTSGPDQFNNLCLALKNGTGRQAGKLLFNSLQDTVCSKYPLIGLLLEALVSAGAYGALVSGSGASVFGLAESEQSARRIAGEVESAAEVPVWSSVVRLLPDGVMVAHGPLEARV